MTSIATALVGNWSKSLRRVLCVWLAVQFVGRPPLNAADAISGCRTWLFGSTVSCVAPPDVDVSVVVRDAVGLERAVGSARSDRTTGSFTVPLRSIVVGERAIVRPSDVIHIAVAESLTATLVVPFMASEISDDGRLLEGVTEPAATMHFGRGRSSSGSDPLDRVEVGVDGGFRFDIDPPLADGEVGFVRISDGSPLTTSAYIVPAFFQLSLAPARLVGAVSPGTAIEIVGREEAGDFTRHYEVPHDSSGSPGAFSLPLPAVSPRSSFIVARRPPGRETVAYTVADVPEMWVALDRSNVEIFGKGPPVRSVRVTAGPSGTRSSGAALIDEYVNTAADGSFRLDVSGTTRAIDPGWFATVSIALAPSLELAAMQVLSYLRAEVHGSTIGGVVETDSSLTVTLQSASGQVKAQHVTRSDDNGAFRSRLVGLGLTTAVAIRPGDRVMVEEGNRGDPLVVDVPNITVHTDSADAVLRGVAEAGARIDVLDGALMRLVAEGRVNVDGTFVIPVPGLAPGVSGAVRVHATSGNQFDVRWASLSVDLDLRQPIAELSGTGLPGRRVDILITTEDAHKVLARLGTELSAGVTAPSWRMPLRDVAGQIVQLQTGDVVEVRVGDERTTFVVPIFEIVPDMVGNSISGRTLPNIPVHLGVQRAPLSTRLRLTDPINTTSDELGRFTGTLPESFVLSHNDTVLALAHAYEGVTVQQSATVHGLTVDLSAAVLLGVVEPGTHRVQITREGRGLALRDPTVTTDDHGRFAVQLVDHSGQVVALTTGDTVTVEAVDQGGHRIVMTIPNLQFLVHWSERIIRGTAPSTNETWIVASPSVFRGANVARSQGEIRPELGANGAFDVGLDEFSAGAGGASGIDVRPGMLLELRSEAPDGTRFVMSERTPFVNVAVEGSAVCVLGSPHSNVSIELHDSGGKQRAKASGSISQIGRWSSGWTNLVGDLVVAQEGDRVVGSVDAQAISVTLSQVEVLPDWRADSVAGRAVEGSRIIGTALPRSEYFVAVDNSTDDPCFVGMEPTRYATHGRTDGSGAFSTDLDRVMVGTAVEVAQYDLVGHRFFRRVKRLQARVHLGTRRVALFGTSASTIELVWSRSDQAMARMRAQLDGFGRAQFELASDLDPEAVFRAGDRLALSSTYEQEAVDLAPLDVDSLGDGSLVGTAPPNATIQIDMMTRDGRAMHHVLTANDDGRFAFGPADLPARSDWQTSDVAVFEIVLAVSEGHQQFLQVLNLALPPGRPNALWLPLLFLPPGRR